MINITTIILSYNEEKNIARCLESIKDWCPVFVVDSFSTDATKEVSHSYGAKFFENTYKNHSSQWNWALNNTPIETDWVLCLDSDFIVTEALKKEIESFLDDKDEKQYNGFYVIHEYCFWRAHIRYGGVKKFWLRGVRKGKGTADISDLVDFRFNVDGDIKYIHAKVIEDNEKDNDLTFWINKQDVFSLRLAVEEELRRRKLLNWEGNISFFGNTDEKFKYLRDIWLKFPLFVRPFILFFYRYFLSLGFLDGIGGFLYHFLQGLWLRMIVDMKIWELRTYRLSDSQLVALSQEMLRHKHGSLGKIIGEKYAESN
ncbi:MAG: glycosyltransferase family 2 protein [Bacteroidota bacterium]